MTLPSCVSGICVVIEPEESHAKCICNAQWCFLLFMHNAMNTFNKNYSLTSGQASYVLAAHARSLHCKR